jgi:hypothetical protein
MSVNAPASRNMCSNNMYPVFPLLTCGLDGRKYALSWTDTLSRTQWAPRRRKPPNKYDQVTTARKRAQELLPSHAMYKSSLLLTPLFLTFASVSAATNPTIHISDQLTRAKAGCTDYLKSTVERGLFSLNAPAATVFLGEYDELERLLVDAGTDKKTAKESADAVTEIHAAAFNYPALQLTAAVFDSLVADKKILVCALSTRCSLARSESNFMLFTKDHEAVLLIPPPFGGAQHFAMNLFSNIGTSAGERVLMMWLKAGFDQQARVAGSADSMYREFAANYDGTFPPNPSSLDQGFTISFMTLFQMLVADNVYTIHRPSRAVHNQAHLAKSVYADLMFGRNKTITAGIMRKLGITEENIFAKSTELLGTMLATIEKDRTD